MKHELPASNEDTNKEQPVKSEQADSDLAHYKAMLLAKARGNREQIMKVLDYGNELVKRCGRERLNKSAYYHLLVGSTPWLETQSDFEVDEEIKGFLQNL